MFYKFRRKGFTLIELLVVIAIIALLLSITMQGLQKVKELAGAAVCMSNNRQLGVAYYTYAEENDGYLTDAKPATTPDGYMNLNYNGRTFRAHSFIAQPMDTVGRFSNTSLEDKIRGFEKGGLWAYLETPDVFHCPTDKRWRKAPLDPSPNVPENAIGGYRSYSLGGVLSADTTGPTTITGENKAAIIKYSEFSNPGSRIVFLEEQAEDGHNENYWNMYLNDTRWWDPFAVVHNGSSTFAYADGHAERHKWTDENVIGMSKGELQKGQRADDSSDDYTWFKRSYVPGHFRK